MTIANIAYNRPIYIEYGREIETEITHLSATIEQIPALAATYPSRWLAIQLLEGDELLLAEVQAAEGGEKVRQLLAESMARLQQHYGEDVDIALADYRYSFVRNLVGSVLTRPVEQRLTLSDRVDRIVTNRYLGVPIFLILMYLVFNLVQNVSAPFLDWIDGVMSGPITNWAIALLNVVNAPDWLISLVVDGAIAGVGGVLVFIPGLMVLYFVLAFLEDSGYMARAAYVMDRYMSLFGLHGKSFLPLIIGFGCNVPAIYATRTIESRTARILTGLMAPFMSCSARLPVYMIFGLTFFPRQASWVIWGMYLVGIVVAAGVGLVMSRSVFKGQQSVFMMEVPPYRMPTLRALVTQMWQRTAHFVHKAGTIILAISIVVWFLLNIPWGVENPRDSLYGQVSAAIAPIFRPAGFGQWESAGSLLTGLIAKEMVVSTMSEIYVGATVAETVEPTTTFGQDVAEIVVSFGRATVEAGQQFLEVLTPGMALFPAEKESKDTALGNALQQVFSPLAALAFLVFVLLYVPCVATTATQIQEFGWKWAGVSIGIQTIVPWTLAVLVYQGGVLLGLG